jgi:hypothetical protein
MKPKNTKKKNIIKEKPKESHSLITKYKGIIKLPPNFNYKEAVAKYLLEKYNKLQ